MNIKGGARRSHLCAVALCMTLGAVSLPLQSVAADGANLEGTWKIAAPQSAFKPEGGAIPFTAEGRKSYQKNKRHQAKREYDDYDYAMARCASPGLTRLMLTSKPFRIWQRTGVVLFQFQWNRLFRHIDMGGLPQMVFGPPPGAGDGPPDAGGPGAPGAGGPGGGPGEGNGAPPDVLGGRAIPISKGHWEGDTLVATSDGFPESLTLIDDLVPHGDQLKVTERLRLRDSDTLENRLTIEDAAYFTRPWQTTVVYKRQPDAAFGEDVCLDRLAAGQSPL